MLWNNLTHKRHPIPRPHGRAMGCLLCKNFGENWPRYNGTVLYHVIAIKQTTFKRRIRRSATRWFRWFCPVRFLLLLQWYEPSSLIYTAVWKPRKSSGAWYIEDNFCASLWEIIFEPCALWPKCHYSLKALYYPICYMLCQALTQWGRVMQICVCKLTSLVCAKALSEHVLD